MEANDRGRTTGLWRYPAAAGDTTLASAHGYHVVATDGRIGHVERVSTEPGTAWLIVDTGVWIFGTRRMIPAGLIDRIDRDAREVHVRVSKDEIRSAPDYEAVADADHTHELAEARHRDALSAHFGRWEI